MKNVPEMFGSMVFNDAVMRERLPEDVYNSLKKTIEEGRDLDIEVANVVATAMKDWAIEKGATHYSHWFQPMTGITAEKHDSFITPQQDGSIIMEFSGKELIKGEPDASSFPSGGLRATFEARGYTAWDPTSYAFIKDDALCIPTVFCSYSGEVLDKKTPLLRSVEILSEEATRVMHLFGETDVTTVKATVGPEQEYFLIDKDEYKKRKDLVITGRTLFGAKPPKGQELEDHYFGVIKPRVMAYMQELNEELWKLGIYAKTEHNEAAPAQHEMAPIFESANSATDHNQLTMEIMKKVADKHGMACLLHEKPFQGVNGSGKHNNWSINTNTGKNLLKPGKKPEENKQFLLFFSAVVAAVDEYQGLIRSVAATAGNDHRLGAAEAPPAIISMYVGEDLEAILNAIKDGVEYKSAKAENMNTGVHVLPDFKKDTTDRNRTSPVAFTGNKFEFRMLGSAMSIADLNIVINTSVADILRTFADRLEKATDFEAEVMAIVKETMQAHSRIIFNGNNYSDEWVKEAESRGLLNLKSSADALPYFASRKNVELFTRNKIFTEAEVRSRCEIMLENYCKVINIEALTLLDMAKKDILPAVFLNIKDLAKSVSLKKSIGMEVSGDADTIMVAEMSHLANQMAGKISSLEAAIAEEDDKKDYSCQTGFVHGTILSAMNELRGVIDRLEVIVGSKYWPYPYYSDMIFSI